MLTTKSIPNLINGVSQQPDSLRYATQCEAQENAYPSIVEGLTKRLPTEHLVNTGISATGKTFVHTINRDTTERYSVIIRDDTIKVFDLMAKNEETVDMGSGSLAYLNTSNADTAFRAVTINDVTFIVNTEKTIAMDSTATGATALASGYEALIFVKQGWNQATTNAYTVTVNDGTTYVDAAANSTTNTDINTVAANLAGDIDSQGDFSASASGSVVYITNSGADFDINANFVHADNYIEVFKGTAQSFAELPTYAKDGMILKIEGNPTDAIDDYYVKFVSLGASGSIGEGTWEECAGPAIASALKFDYTTMPHILIRQADNTFVFKKADGVTHDSYDYSAFKWGERQVGDLLTEPNPSFIGEKINDICLFKNRLGFLAGENVIFTEAGEFFNFWRITIIDLLDTAPIDVAVANRRVSILRYAIPLVEKLVMFSEDAQFVLQGGTTLTPKTVSIAQTTSFGCLRGCEPVISETSIFFGFNRGSYSGVREYYPGDLEDQYEGTDISSHVPTYLAGNITKISAASHESVVCCMVDGDTDALYVYNYYNQGRERLQSAWHRFTFGTDVAILGMDFIDTDLYLVVQRTQGVFIEKLPFELGKVDTGSTYTSRLDRRVDTPAINATGTTITLPYHKSPGRNIEVITKAGVRIPIQTQTDGSASIVVDTALLDVSDSGGITDTVSTTVDYVDLTTATSTEDNGSITAALAAEGYYVGESYDMSYTFSDVTLKQQTQTGGYALITDGRIQLRYGTIAFANSGYFSVEVTPDYRDTSTHNFTGRILGSGQLIIGSVPIESGEYRFPVFSKADQVGITVTNDTPLPSALMSAEFELNWTPRGRRVGL
jgi:hypothetical protein